MRATLKENRDRPQKLRNENMRKEKHGAPIKMTDRTQISHKEKLDKVL